MVDSRRYRKILVLVPTASLLVLFGGSHSAFWAPVIGVFFLLTAALPWTETRRGAVGLPKTGMMLILCFLLLYPLLQALPLPMALLGMLSPVRAGWLDKAGQLLARVPDRGTVSYLPLKTLMHGCLWLFLAVHAWLLSRILRHGKDRIWYYNLLLVLASMEAVYGIVQVLVPTVGVLWDSGLTYRGYARGTFINRNHYGAFLGMLWPVLIGYTLALRHQRPDRRPVRNRDWVAESRETLIEKKGFMVFLTGLVILALFFSQSRGAILSSLAALTVFAALVNLRGKRLVLAVVGCWLVMLSYGSILGFDGILSRFSRMENDAAGRFVIWSESWSLAADHPFTGTGLGTYQEVYQAYQHHLPETTYTRHTHNDYLQMAAELGFPAAGLLAVLVWGFWWKNAIRVYRTKKASSPESNYLAAGALAGTASFLLHCWLDFNWQMAANALMFTSLCVLIRALQQADGS